MVFAMLAGCVPEPPKPVTALVPPHARYTIVSRFSDGIVFSRVTRFVMADTKLVAKDEVDYAGPWQKTIADFLGSHYDGTYVPLDFKFGSYPAVGSSDFLGQIAVDDSLSAGDIAQLSQAIDGRDLDFVILLTEGSYGPVFGLKNTAYGHGLHRAETIGGDFSFGYAIYTISVYDVHDWSKRVYIGMSVKNAKPFLAPDDLASISPALVKQAQDEVATLWPPIDTDFAFCYFGFVRDIQVADEHTRAYTCNQAYPAAKPGHSGGPMNIPAYWLSHPKAGHADLHQ